MKTCSQCGKTRTLSEFSKQRDASDGYRSHCKECTARYSRRWAVLNRSRMNSVRRKWRAEHKEQYANQCRRYRKKNPATGRRNARKKRLKKYGLTLDAYEILLRSQDSQCAICGAERGATRHEALCVDHRHSDGSVRGLLCRRCNLLLGHAEDSVALLQAAVAYLESYD